jgi:hypothetical protein
LGEVVRWVVHLDEVVRLGEVVRLVGVSKKFRKKHKRFHDPAFFRAFITKQDACAGVHTDLKMATYVLYGARSCNRQGIQIVNRKRMRLKAWRDREEMFS